MNWIPLISMYPQEFPITLIKPLTDLTGEFNGLHDIHRKSRSNNFNKGNSPSKRKRIIFPGNQSLLDLLNHIIIGMVGNPPMNKRDS